jgi:hypothetical protein
MNQRQIEFSRPTLTGDQTVLFLHAVGNCAISGHVDPIMLLAADLRRESK